ARRSPGVRRGDRRSFPESPCARVGAARGERDPDRSSARVNGRGGRARVARMANERTRNLVADDAPTCVALARTVGWSGDAGRWRTMIAVGEAIGVESGGGELLGTVIVNRFGDALATIAMMVVSAAHQRRGLGMRLMREALARTGDHVTYLYATPF